MLILFGFSFFKCTTFSKSVHEKENVGSGVTIVTEPVSEIENVGDADVDEFDAYDANQDQQMDQDEFNIWMGESETFNQWDTDLSGDIDEYEFNEGTRNWGDQQKQGFTEADDQDVNTQEGVNTQENTTGANYLGTFEDWDKDESGFIDQNEFFEGIYNKWDTDRDESLSTNEFNKIINSKQGQDGVNTEGNKTEVPTDEYEYYERMAGSDGVGTESPTDDYEYEETSNYEEVVTESPIDEYPNETESPIDEYPNETGSAPDEVVTESPTTREETPEPVEDYVKMDSSYVDVDTTITIEKREAVRGYLNSGNLVHYVPDSMIVNQPSRVSLVISKFKSGTELAESVILSIQHEAGLDTSRIEFKEIKISKLMTAYIYVMDSAFRIVPLSRYRQYVHMNDTAENKWEWSVIPMKSGNHNIIIKVSARVFDGSDSGWVDIDVYNDIVTVNSIPAPNPSFIQAVQAVINGWAENYVWILATLGAIGTFITWLLTFFNKVKKEPENEENDKLAERKKSIENKSRGASKKSLKANQRKVNKKY